MENYLILDNFFDEPDLIRNYALAQEYFKKEQHPNDIGNFPGYRSRYINELNSELFNVLVQTEIKMVEQILGHPLADKYTEYWTKFSFSWTDETTPVNRHHDFMDDWNGFKDFFGGVIYLTPNPPTNSGTEIVDIVEVENVYNRFVMYNAKLLHGAQSSFGKDINDSRLVLTHFIYLK
jgi:hypothetical protein